MNKIVLPEKAYAKINLALDIVRKRADGYHDLKMVMASVSLCDDIEVTLTPCEAGRERFTAESRGSALPQDESNLAVKAARLFFAKRGFNGFDTHINIVKRIPVSAGLGGGSSDAAAVLRALSARFPLPDRLTVPALELGSDVPYCLRGGVRLAEGRGELLSPLPPLPDCRIVLVTPPVRVSTAEAFRAISVPAFKTDWTAFLDAMRRRDLPAIAKNLANAFPDRYSDARTRLLNAGALGVVMSGSGPSVFGMFDDEDLASRAADSLRAIFPDTFLTEPV
ncbi:MAG: 4-(cytidine 5'-diphospho)-2-C-methyl-D-erythritol kinase [Oscillospiraceae bacterium]|jgi:4-diphosphocytidyl-2-C-methyl-D-erythritol kinase|nr:4-(cytidine 5'-diphospho)-2-C-methyl-D-erythritol kinase [Oscillospiraceae bacterium]